MRAAAKEVIEMMDCSGDDLISEAEFHDFLEIVGYDDETINGLWKSIDTSEDSVIDEMELAQSVSLDRLLHCADDKVKRLVRYIDKNGDGKVSAAEMMAYLVDKCGMAMPDASKRMGELDTNGDGVISIEELRRCKNLAELLEQSGIFVRERTRAAVRSAGAKVMTKRTASTPLPPPPPPPPPLVLEKDDGCDLGYWVCKRSPDYRTASAPKEIGGQTDDLGSGKGAVGLSLGLAVCSLGVLFTR